MTHLFLVTEILLYEITIPVEAHRIVLLAECHGNPEKNFFSMFVERKFRYSALFTNLVG
jgi:hypothetical protein